MSRCERLPPTPYWGWISGAAGRFTATGIPDAEARELAISMLASLEARSS